MKKYLFPILFALLSLASCKTHEKIVYLQDLQPNENIQAQAIQTLKLVPGDKVGVTVTSAATPELAERYNLSSGTSSSQNQDNLRYTLDENGDIDMLGIGRTHIGGLTRSEAAAKIQSIFRAGVLNDAIVTVAAYNRFVTVLGEVKSPGRLEMKRDNMTIIEAIGAAGDLTITGRRDAIKVIRQEGTVAKTYFVDLRSKDIFNSPVYNLQQNDIVIVEPNKVKIGQSTINDNAFRSVSMWMAIASFLMSLGVVILR